MAQLIPEKNTCIAHQFWPVQKATGYHPGPVAPPIADGATLVLHNRRVISCYKNRPGSEFQN